MSPCEAAPNVQYIECEMKVIGVRAVYLRTVYILTTLSTVLDFSSHLPALN